MTDKNDISMYGVSAWLSESNNGVCTVRGALCIIS